MHLALSLLGNFHIRWDDTAVTQFRSDKERALLAVLVLDQERPYRRETLASMFWGDQPAKLAFNNLRKTLHRLRQTLQEEKQSEPFLLVTAKDVQWNVAAPVWVDAWQFTSLLAQSRHHQHRRVESCQVCRAWLETAVSLYQGNLLDGFSLPDAPEFDEWIIMRREPLRSQALTTLNHLIAHDEWRGEGESAIRLARRLLALEPWQESAHRVVMRLLAAAGDRNSALVQYERCRALLATELRVEPERETTVLYELIRSGERNSLPGKPRSSLPSVPTPMIGRVEELAQLEQQLLHPETRLVTLVGEGGIGKTRLALAVAEAVAYDFPNGVWFIDFSAVADEIMAEAGMRLESYLVTLVATALGLSLSGSQVPKTQVLGVLKKWACLLLLDNFETIMRGAELLAEILRAAPGVVVLITSREPLRLQMEQVVRLGGLTVPLADGVMEETAVADSLLLFQQIAQRSGGQLHTNDLPVICEICRFLEGIPLGIELAAVWTARLSPAEILDTLQHQADSLTLPYRDVPERHRTMPTVFAGSWRLLTPGQQLALAQAAVFRGGFSRTAARQIIDSAGVDVVALVDKSLLRLTENGRYTCHELLRQFAAAQLANPDELAQRHARFYLNYVAERAEALWGDEPQHTLAELQLEFENISTAWQWAVHEGSLDLLRQSLGGLATYYVRIGLSHEGIQVLTGALTAVASSPSEHRELCRGWLHVELARLQAAVAQLATAKNYAELACQIGADLDDALLQGWAQFRWSRVLWMQALYKESRTHLEAALAIAQMTGIKRLEAECWLAMSALADTHGGNFALAREYGETALSLFRMASNSLGELRMLILLGNFCWATGDYGLSQGFYEYTLPLSREVNSRSDEAAALANLGMVLREQGDYEQASVYAEQALRLFQEMGDPIREFVTLSNISLLRHQMGQDLLALISAQQALAVARELETLAAESQPLCCLGHALLALNRPQEAAVAYAESMRLHRAAGNTHLAMDPLAGLVRVALVQQNMPEARAFTEEILAHLAQATLDGTSEPIRVLWTVCEFLMTAQDPRAQAMLAETHQALMARADKMVDRVKRQLFLTNIAVHRAVQAAWANRTRMI